MILDIVLGTFFAVFTHIFMTTLFMSGVVIAFEYSVKNNTDYLDKLIWLSTSISQDVYENALWKC